MTAGWVAAAMRGRALLRSEAGTGGARQIAIASTWAQGRDLLGRTIAGRNLSAGADRSTAHAAASTATIWQLRVLAGWVPPSSTSLVRVAAGPIEIGNIERHLAALEGAPRADAIPLGSLATAWPRVAACASAGAVRDVLRRSVWGDPGGADVVDIALGLRVAWLRRVRFAAPEMGDWARAGTAVLVARERFAFDREIADATRREIDRALGRRWHDADSITDLFDRLPERLRWPLADVDDPALVWRAERALIRRAAGDARRRAAAGADDRASVAAIITLLLVDLWRVHAAIELAGHGPTAGEVFDDVVA